MLYTRAELQFHSNHFPSVSLGAHCSLIARQRVYRTCKKAVCNSSNRLTTPPPRRRSAAANGKVTWSCKRATSLNSSPRCSSLFRTQLRSHLKSTFTQSNFFFFLIYIFLFSETKLWFVCFFLFVAVQFWGKCRSSVDRVEFPLFGNAGGAAGAGAHHSTRTPTRHQSLKIKRKSRRSSRSAQAFASVYNFFGTQPVAVVFVAVSFLKKKTKWKRSSL